MRPADLSYIKVTLWFIIIIPMLRILVRRLVKSPERSFDIFKGCSPCSVVLAICTVVFMHLHLTIIGNSSSKFTGEYIKKSYVWTYAILGWIYTSIHAL